MQDACAFDGSKALVVARPPRLKGGEELPSDYTKKLEVVVTGVDVPEKGTKATWQVSGGSLGPVLENTAFIRPLNVGVVTHYRGMTFTWVALITNIYT